MINIELTRHDALLVHRPPSEEELADDPELRALYEQSPYDRADFAGKTVWRAHVNYAGQRILLQSPAGEGDEHIAALLATVAKALASQLKRIPLSSPE